jgi:hypothetical protein
MKNNDLVSLPLQNPEELRLADKTLLPILTKIGPPGL